MSDDRKVEILEKNQEELDNEEYERKVFARQQALAMGGPCYIPKEDHDRFRKLGYLLSFELIEKLRQNESVGYIPVKKDELLCGLEATSVTDALGYSKNGDFLTVVSGTSSLILMKHSIKFEENQRRLNEEKDYELTKGMRHKFVVTRDPSTPAFEDPIQPE